jgi:hypothetical protein
MSLPNSGSVAAVNSSRRRYIISYDPPRGQTTGRTNERDYPHIVEVPVPNGGFGDTSWAIEGFHKEHGIESKRGRGSYDEGQFYVRYCFHDPAVADAFRARFGGERLIAARRPVR